MDFIQKKKKKDLSNLFCPLKYHVETLITVEEQSLTWHL